MAEVGIVITTKEDGSIEVKKLGDVLEEAGKKGEEGAKKTKNAWAKAAEKIGKASTKIGKSLSLKVTAPLLLAGGLALKTAIGFETAFTGVRKTVAATEKQFAALDEGFKSLAREIPVATDELYGIGEAAGQLGIKRNNILAFTEVMAALGATTNLASEEAATALARFGNITKLASGDYDRLGATIVALGNNLATTEREIVEMGLRLAGAGTAIGLTQAQILALAGSLSSVGIQAEAGGTAFSQVMKRIDKEIGTGSQKMKDFAAISGKSVAAFEKQWKENAAGALIGFTEGLAKVQGSGANVNIVLDELGLEGMRVSDALLRASGAGDLFRKALGLGSAAWKENTALAKEAELRYGTAASRLIIAKNRTLQMAAAFGEVLAPAFLKIITWIQPLIDWLTQLSPTTKAVIVVVGGVVAAIGPLLIGLGMLTVAIGTLTAVSSPWLLIIGAIIVAVAVLGVAAYQLIKHWEPVKKFFVGLWETINERFGESFSKIAETASKIWNKVTDIFAFAGSVLSDALTGIVNFLTDIWQKYGDGIIAIVDSAFRLILAVISSVLTVISGVIQFYVDMFSGNWRKAFTGLYDTAVKVLGELLPAIGTALNNILTFVDGLIADFIDLGRNLIMGMVEGVKSAVRWLVDAAVAAVNAAISAAKSVLGISSPSSVFAEVGKQMMAGMAAGIKRAAFMPQLALVAALPGGGGLAHGSYADGTPFVPRDMIAQIHQGEMIVPADLNPNNPASNSYDQRQDNRAVTFVIQGGNAEETVGAIQEALALPGDYN